MEKIDFSKLGFVDFNSLLASFVQGSFKFGLKLLVAIVILVVGLWLSNRITRSLKYAMARRNLDLSLQSFLGSFVNIMLKVFVVVIVMTTVGVQMTSIVAVLGAASLAIGMALSGTLQNIAGGFVILVFKPFKVGDTIETASGKIGVVKKIMIFTTELHTFDNQVVFLPNGALSNGEITNLSDGAIRRTDLTIGISYGDSVDAARRVILGILDKDKRVLKDPAPTVVIQELGDSAVVLLVRYWSAYSDILGARADVIEQIYETLPKKKISFPFPQMDVHIVK